MKVIVAGGRGYADKDFLFTVLDRLRDDLDIDFIIHGAAAGADSLAGQWARDRGVQEVVCPANWNKHGRRAGYLRNVAMADLVDKDDEAALIYFPGGVGTNMMVEIAEERGMTVIDALDYRR